MRTLDRLKRRLDGEAGEKIQALGDTLYEVRLRAGRGVQLLFQGGEWLGGEPVEPDRLRQLLASLMDHSFYTREDELRQGFFTMEDGCRVGVCGRLLHNGEQTTGMAAVGSVCIRVNREIRGCAEGLIPEILTDDGGIRSTLLLSGPGLGKTTMLRELARRLSDGGVNVCIADERHEIAASAGGIPTLDVGARTDVMDGSPKRVVIPHMLRAMAPRVIVTDEIGGPEDAAVLAEAVRCGVSVIGSAHAGSFEQFFSRRSSRGLSGVFELGALLGSPPGRIVEVRDLKEDWHAVRTGAVRGGGLCAVRQRSGGVGAAAG